MWINLLKWLLKFALQSLGENLDAEENRRVAEYNRRVAEVEKAREQSQIELDKIAVETLELQAKRKKYSEEFIETQSQIEYLDNQILRIKDEKDKKIRVIRALDDDSALHSEL